MRGAHATVTAAGLALAALVGAAPAAAADPVPSAAGFDERYQGRHIRGWTGPLPCVFVDGVYLPASEVAPDLFVTAVAAYEPVRGLADATRHAVRVLAGEGLTDQGTPAPCGGGTASPAA